MQRSSPTPVSDEELADLATRLRRFRSVPLPQGEDFRGVDPDLLRELLHRWANGFDWRQVEQRIALFEWWETELSAVPIRSIVQHPARSADENDDAVVLLLHGWPDSVLRFERILPLLKDMTLVIPALPGFPFASATEKLGMSSIEMADAVAEAMSEMGFDQYTISAGDVGCDVAEALAARHPSAVRALHLTDLSQYHFLNNLPQNLDETERAYVKKGSLWQKTEGGYMHEQSTRPLTLAVGLGDSPAGTAAWILEKLVDWTDSGRDLRNVFTLDEALTWISAYWFTSAIGTSIAPYAASAPKDWPRIHIPTVVTMFGHDLVNAPRQFVERYFTVVDWIEFPEGGHFAAWEKPESYVEGIRRAVKLAQLPRYASTENVT